jgi:enoyl-CoA hydratase/carnithine racemase
VPTLSRDGDLAVLNLGEDENRFSPPWLDAMHGLLDELEGLGTPAALVTVADGRFWSNGLDLDWLTGHVEEADSYLLNVQRLFARVLVLGMPTVAAIQGHCYAAGAMLATAHDWRVMRADRGFYCLPEVDLGLPFPPGMDALLRAKLPLPGVFDAMVTGRRYGGQDAAAAGLVTTAVAEDAVLNTAGDMVRDQAAKASANLSTIKSTMYADVLALLVPAAS